MIRCVYRFQFNYRFFQGFLAFDKKQDRKVLLGFVPKLSIAFRLLDYFVLRTALDLEVKSLVFKSSYTVRNYAFRDSFVRLPIIKLFSQCQRYKHFRTLLFVLILEGVNFRPWRFEPEFGNDRMLP